MIHKTPLYSWTLILSPGQIDRDWARDKAKRDRKRLWKGILVGLWLEAGMLALGYMIVNWRTMWN